MNHESHNPEWWRTCSWRVGMRARTTSPNVLREWRDRKGTVVGILEHEVKLELDGEGRPLVWFRKSEVAPTVDEQRPSDARCEVTYSGRRCIRVAQHDGGCDFERTMIQYEGRVPDEPRPNEATPRRYPYFAVRDVVNLAKGDLWPGMKAGTLATITDYDDVNDVVTLDVEGYGPGFSTAGHNVSFVRRPEQRTQEAMSNVLSATERIIDLISDYVPVSVLAAERFRKGIADILAEQRPDKVTPVCPRCGEEDPTPRGMCGVGGTHPEPVNHLDYPRIDWEGNVVWNAVVSMRNASTVDLALDRLREFLDERRSDSVTTPEKSK